MTQPGERIPCPNCQAANFPSSEICWRCGRPLKTQSQPTSTPAGQGPQQDQWAGGPSAQPPRPSSDMTTLVIIGFILAVCSVSCCFLSGILAVVLGGIAYGKGDSRGIWVMVAGAAGTILGTVISGLMLSFMNKVQSPPRLWPGM